MSYLTIENFKAGLDKRRSSLSSAVGTLDVATNCHISSGGEVEKRKGFFRYARPAGTFGLLKTNAGLITFGSATTPTGLPAFLTYQRLQHPAVLDGTSYDAAKHAMTAIVSATTFGGLAFVVATFADTHSYVYYNGTLIEDFIAGLILEYMDSLAKIANKFETLVNATGRYTAVQRANPNDDKVDVYGPVSVLYDTVIVKVTAAGSLTSNFVSEGNPAEAATQASARFEIVAGIAGGEIGSVSEPAFGLTTNPVAYGIDVAATARAVAIEINGTQTTYFARADGGVVTLTAVATGATPNGTEIEVVADAVMVDRCSFVLTGTAFQVPSITVNGVELLSAGWRATPGTTDDFPTVDPDLNVFCTLLAAAVSSEYATTGYIAIAVENRIYLSRQQAVSTDTGAKSVVVTVNGSGIAGPDEVPPATVSLSVYSITGFRASSGGQFLSYQTAAVKAVPIGGTSPFLFNWVPATDTSSAGIRINEPSKQKTQFSRIATGAKPFPQVGQFICRVTDALGVVTTSPILTVNC